MEETLKALIRIYIEPITNIELSGSRYIVNFTADLSTLTKAVICKMISNVSRSVSQGNRLTFNYRLMYYYRLPWHHSGRVTSNAFHLYGWLNPREVNSMRCCRQEPSDQVSLPYIYYLKTNNFRIVFLRKFLRSHLMNDGTMVYEFTFSVHCTSVIHYIYILLI